MVFLAGMHYECIGDTHMCNQRGQIRTYCAKAPNIWINEGRPHGHQFESHTTYRAAKRSFCKAQANAMHDIEMQFYNELQDAADPQ